MSAQIIPLRKVVKRRGPYKKRSPEPHDFDRALGERLQYARHQLGISEQEAAAAWRVCVRTYRGYEAGKPTRMCRGFSDFTDAFGISVSWLVGDPEAEAPRFRLRAV